MPILENKKFLKTSEVQSGDIIKFKDEGEWVESKKFTYPDGTPRNDFMITVEINGENRSLRLNKTNRDVLVAVFGKDTMGWVGKEVKLHKVNALVAGKMMDTLMVEI